MVSEEGGSDAVPSAIDALSCLVLAGVRDAGLFFRPGNEALYCSCLDIFPFAPFLHVFKKIVCVLRGDFS